MNIRNSVITLSVLIGLILLFAGGHVLSLLQQVASINQEKRVVEAVYHAFEKTHQGVEEILLLQSDASMVRQSELNVQTMEQLLNQAIQTRTHSYHQNLGEIQSHWRRYSGLLKELLSLDHVVPDNDQALLVFIELVELKGLVESQFHQLLSAVSEDEVTQVDTIRQHLFWGILLIIVIVVLVLLYLYFRIVPALSRLSTTLMELSGSGDLSQALELKGNSRKDEIYFLTYSFNHLIGSLQQSEKLLKKSNFAQEKSLLEIRSILEAIDEGLVVLDQDGNILQVNPKLARLTGKEPQQLQGQSFHVLLKGADQIDLSGLLTTFKSRIQRIHDEDHEKFHQTLQQAPVPLIVVDLDSINGEYTVFLTSHGFEQQFGYSQQALQGQPLRKLMLSEEYEAIRQRLLFAGTVMGSLDQHRYYWRRANGGELVSEVKFLRIECGGNSHVLIQLESTENIDQELLRITPYGRLMVDQGLATGSDMGWELMHQDGTLIPVHMSGSPLYRQQNEERQLSGAVFVISDMRDILSAEQARRSNKAKDDFLASMSHELRTPLSSIIGNSEILSESHMSPDQRKMLHSIEISGRALLSLINDILDFSKITAGNFKVEQSSFAIHSLIEEIQHIFTSRFVDAGLRFDLDIREPLGEIVVGDGRRIGQILINILSKGGYSSISGWRERRGHSILR
ncbi:MAG: PAS domain S-box protein [Gammaproteobacteria bacterium]|nr:PAS domain S-box protein [Gammaproteobacteria bacterium]MBT3490195.1 PAS domain S-box protein [Gammaproteobacteria bacterium]MBT3718742.1 PAS domain S-box protein [Gammaproteobacteria bacterium]MBT3845765.1 PAS domain S-box protein [Gammaproteobacteria bacterium]MBT3892047.1 PAS domain S-box protein [Gammaproteobacteria bacterium]